MDAIFSFLFSTRTGVAILFVGGIALFTAISILAERKTRKIYFDHGPDDEDDEDDQDD